MIEGCTAVPSRVVMSLALLTVLGPALAAVLVVVPQQPAFAQGLPVLGTDLSVELAVPPDAKAGTVVPERLTITSSSLLPVSVTGIEFEPDCPSLSPYALPTTSGGCSAAPAGVSVSPSGIGSGLGCPGTSFQITSPARSGSYMLDPQTPVTLVPLAGLAPWSCTISFSVAEGGALKGGPQRQLAAVTSVTLLSILTGSSTATATAVLDVHPKHPPPVVKVAPRPAPKPAPVAAPAPVVHPVPPKLKPRVAAPLPTPARPAPVIQPPRARPVAKTDPRGVVSLMVAGFALLYGLGGGSSATTDRTGGVA